MAINEAEVANLALLRIGERQRILSLNEAGTAAEVAKACWSICVGAALAAAPWPFCRKRKALSLTAEERDGWTYAYTLPADAVPDGPMDIWTGVRNPARSARIPFALELNDAGTRLLVLTDQQNAVLRYNANNRVVALWGDSFSDAVAWRLAMEFALSLAVKPNVGQLAARGYQQAVEQAWAVWARAQQEDVPPESDSITVRG